MTVQLSGLPDRTDIIVDPGPYKGQKRSWFVTKQWLNWFQQLVRLVADLPVVIASIQLSGYSDSIGVTPTGTAAITNSPFRVTWSGRIVTEATTSSSLALTVYWTSGGVLLSYTFPAMTGNVANDYESESILFTADQGSVISYSVAYASNAANEMVYDVALIVEDMP